MCRRLLGCGQVLEPNSFDPTTSLPAAISGSAGLDIEITRFGTSGDYRMESLTHKWSTSKLASSTYEYDALGNILRQETDHDSQRLFDYYYDEVDRLIGAEVSDPGTGTQIDSIVYEKGQGTGR